MAVVANQDADLAVGRLEHRKAEIARLEIELFDNVPAMGNVHLAELADDVPVGPNHCGRIVIDAGNFALVDGRHDNQAVLARLFGDGVGRRAGDGLGQIQEPFVALAVGEVGKVEEFL